MTQKQNPCAVLYGVPGVIEKMRQASWKRFDRNGELDLPAAEFWSGLKFFNKANPPSWEYLEKEPDAYVHYPCILIIKELHSAKPPLEIHGFVSYEVKTWLDYNCLGIVTHFCEEAVGNSPVPSCSCGPPIREELKLCRDERHNVEYQVLFKL